MSNITHGFDALQRAAQEPGQEDPELVDSLLRAVYDELRGLAQARLAREAPGQTLQATALVHEAWMRLVGSEQRPWKDRAYFFAAAAESMRRILVERARAVRTQKRGGELRRVELETRVEVADQGRNAGATPIEILALDEALENLAKEDARKAELVKLRYFAGLTLPQVAELLEISQATAERDWAYARAFLFQALREESGDGSIHGKP